MELPWVCLECGARQANAGRCAACKRDDTCDLRDDKIVVLAADIELRLAREREKRHRLLGVVVGMATVIALWFVPGYWTVQRQMALPFYFDQWLFMAGIGLGVMYLLGRRKRRRFPYLTDDLTVR